MYNTRLIYASSPSKDYSPPEIVKIVNSARKNNPKLGVTGILCFDNKFFIQWIEGPRDNINKLFQVISADSRHENITILEYCYIHARHFEDWSMAYIPSTTVDVSLVNRYKLVDEIDPFKMSGDGARLFLLDILESHKAKIGEAPEF